MLSEQMQEKYDEAFEEFTKCFAESKVDVRHRSKKKFEDHTNQDISLYYDDQFICGVYVAKKGYKLYLDNKAWYSLTAGKPSIIKEDGWYSVMFEDLEDCISDVKNYVQKEVL